MIKPNSSNSNNQFLATQKSLSNTPLDHHNTLTFTNNSFNLLLPLQTDSHFSNNLLSIHLDYLRISTTNLTKKSFTKLVDYLFSEVTYKIINKPSHPHPGTPKSKKYQKRIVSQTGVVLRYTKRAKFRGKNTRYVYDIMIDFTGAYFADLTLLEQLELIYYLNSNYKLKCHRIDVAIDDYSRKLFPVGQMITAYLEDNQFGFKDIDDNYLDIINNKLIGTLGIGSRHSSLFIRIYTRHKYFVRWETELKRKKAQKLFDKLASFTTEKSINSLPIKAIHKTLIDTAIGKIDFRDKSNYTNKQHASKNKTKKLLFWQAFRQNIYSSIESLTDSNYTRIS